MIRKTSTARACAGRAGGPSAAATARMAVVDPPDPRFTQANERTFLAWVRTALAPSFCWQHRRRRRAQLHAGVPRVPPPRQGHPRDPAVGRGQRPLLRMVRGKAWLTETGGIVAFRDGRGKLRFRYSERRAASALRRMFALARKHRNAHDTAVRVPVVGRLQRKPLRRRARTRERDCAPRLLRGAEIPPLDPVDKRTSALLPQER